VFVATALSVSGWAYFGASNLLRASSYVRLIDQLHG
jgi:hypothetical protein